MPNDAHAAHATLPRPVIFDSVWYPHLRAAAQAAELSYGRLYEAVRRGRSLIDGHTIAEPPERLTIKALNGDEADLEPCREAPQRPRIRGKGSPLIRYPPGEGPLDRGLMQCH
jgi:hypothetical protein